MTAEVFGAAFILGLMGAGHCLGMCGGLAAALSFANQGASAAHRFAILVAYNLGRILSYGVIGFIFGYLFSGANTLTPVPILRVLSGVLLIAMGLYLADWWKILTLLEKLGAVLWRYIAPLGKKLMPVTQFHSALLLGLLWGWLPCGLVYSILVLAAGQGTGTGASIVMMAFGLGTLPAVLAGGIASDAIKRFIAHAWVRKGFGIAFMLYGIITLWPVVIMALRAAGVIEVEAMMNGTHHH